MSVVIPGKLVFLANPRTASVATTTALSRLPGAISTIDTNHHAQLKDLSDFLTGGELICTTVRCHWDTICSWWLLNGCPGTIWDFVNSYEHSHYARGNQLWWLHPQATYVMKYESLQEGLDIACKICDLDRITLQHENVTEGKKDWQSVFDYRSYVYVRERFSDEIFKYGYL